jgi:hypothetical protein
LAKSANTTLTLPYAGSAAMALTAGGFSALAADSGSTA